MFSERRNAIKLSLKGHKRHVPTTTMLTRHLYRYDEIRAALLWSIARGRTTEGMFWVQEFLDSELFDELYQTLLEGWIWFIGIRNMEWCRRFWEVYTSDEVEEETMLLLAYQLFRSSARDSTVLTMLLAGPSVVLERLPPTPKTNVLLETARFKSLCTTPVRRALVRYIRTGKALSAWKLAVGDSDLDSLVFALGSSDAQDSLHSLEQISSTFLQDNENLRIATRAVAVGFLCMKPSLQRASLAKSTYQHFDSVTQTEWNEWKSCEGRRARRMYTPPRDCLPWITSRGWNTYKKTTIRELRNLSIDGLRDKGCPFWVRVLDESNPWSDDSAYEDFWDTYFPDDIPDEWSKKDQEKSHGEGALSLHDTQQNLFKMIQRWFRFLTSAVIWNAPSLCDSIAKLQEPIADWAVGHTEKYAKEMDLSLPRDALKLRFEIQGVNVEVYEFVKSVKPIVVEEDDENTSDDQ